MKTREEIIRLLMPVFEKNGTKKATLFGSYAKGTQTENSDLDILVDSGLHGLRFYGLLEDVCQAVDMPVDLIDVYQLEKDGSMSKDIERTGMTIYERA